MRVQIRSRLSDKIKAKVKEALANAKPKLIALVVNQLGQHADTRLHSTAVFYKEGLNHPAAVTLSEKGVRIELQGLARELENGWPAFDMKKALLQSKQAKTAKNGKRYVDVTFRHGYESTTRNYKGMPAAMQAKVKAAVASETRVAAKQKRPEQNPLRVIGRMPGSTVKQSRLTAAGTKRVSVTRKTSIYSDMLRTKLMVGRSARSKYETFRRVSARSNPNAWWHPGFSGVKAIPATIASLSTTARQVVLQELRALGVKAK